MNAMTDITTAPAEELAAGRMAAAAMSAALAKPSKTPSLADMLDERNAIVARLNASPVDDESEVKRAWALEQAIVSAPCKSIEDAAAKTTLFETIDGEGLVWNDDSAWNMVVDIAPFVRAAADLQNGSKIYGSYADRSPTAALQAIIAAARDYSERYVVPAERAHDAAETAVATDGEDAERLAAAEAEAEATWSEHRSAHRKIVEHILDLRAGSPADLLVQVETFADLLTPHHSQNSKAATVIGRLTEDDVALVAEHMLAGLRRFAGPSPEDRQLVHDADSFIQLHREPASSNDAKTCEHMERAIRTPARSGQGLAAKARLVEEWLPVDLLDRTDLEWRFVISLIDDVKAMFGDGPPTTSTEVEFEAVFRTAKAAEQARRAAGTALRAFQDAHPAAGDGTPGHDQLSAAVDRADHSLFAALGELIATPAPSAAAMAAQIQAYAWTNVVTDHVIDGLNGWPLDPAQARVVAAVDDDGTSEERGLVALYRSACALAGGIELQPINIDSEMVDLPVATETTAEPQDLERRIDQAIADLPFLASRNHGLTDQEWQARFDISSEAVREVAELEGDDPETQRLRLKAMRWVCDDEIPDADDFGESTNQRLGARIVRTAMRAVL